MGTFFQELAKKLAERWLTLVVVPGVLFLAVAALGVRLGHRHALDHTRLRGAVAEGAAWITRQQPGTQALALVAVLVGAAAVGLAVQASAGATRTVWLGLWPGPFAPLARRGTARRRRRWRARVAERRQVQQLSAPESRTPDQQHRIDLAAARVNRLALAEPGRPTWMGDRVHAQESVAAHRYGLDLGFAWPRLWLVLPDAVRAEITAATGAFAAATASGSWAWPYLLLGGVWWPAAMAGCGIGLAAWVRARAAVADLTVLSEAALDLHGRDLAAVLGVAEPGRAGPLTLAEGREITALVRKGR